MASETASHAQARPRRSVHNHRGYREPDTDTDSDEGRAPQTLRPSRSARRIQSYREDSDSDERPQEYLSDSSITSIAEAEPSQQLTRRASQDRSLLPKRGRQPQGAGSRGQLANFKRRKFAQPIAHHGKLARDSSPINFPVRGRVPSWQSLEYQIWVKILRYASNPLYDHSGRCSQSVDWLLAVSRLCKILHEAAIAVLAWSPPLHPSYRAHGLLDLLSKPQEQLTLDYTTKIHALDIEVKQLLIRKSGIHLKSLIGRTPLLKHLRIFHGHDDLMGRFVWAMPVFGRDKWAYGDLFDHLDTSNIMLRSFEWNGRFRDTGDAMMVSTTKRSMSSIRCLKFINFSLEEREEEKRATIRDATLSAIAPLTDLKMLDLTNCNIVDTTFMSQMPPNLSELTISTCQSLTSDALQDYLSRAGSSLTKLHLIGNQVMDLGFTPDLKRFCSNLQDLLIDLSYEDSSSYSDRDPLFDHLLPHGRPTWPPKLESLVVGPLRSLSVADAEDFYQSLIDAAEELVFLRNLSIKTLLKDASWRDRAQMRSKWAAILNHVFLTKVPTILPPPLPKPAVQPSSSTKNKKRKSARIQELEDNHITESTRHSQVEEDASLQSLPRQNRCERVQFELSDQRPAQEQYREEDFLDDELSGDEEWNEH